MHPTARSDCALRISDDRPVTQNRRSGLDVDQRNFVRLGNILDQRQSRIEPRSRRQAAFVLGKNADLLQRPAGGGGNIEFRPEPKQVSQLFG